MDFGRSLEEYLKSHDEFGDFLQFLYALAGIPNNSSLSSYFLTIFTDTNRTILMSCAKENCYKICRHIIESFPQCLNIVNRYGYNALHYASFHGHLAVIQLLTEHGIHILIKNSYHEYPFDSASISGHTDAEYVLLSKFLYGFNPLAGGGRDTTTKFYDLATPMTQSGKNYDFIESQNCNLWSSSISFPLQLDDYLFKSSISSQSSTVVTSHQLSLPTLDDSNSFESLAFLKKHVLVVCRIISSDGKGEIGKEYDLLSSLSPAQPSTITIGRSQSNSMILSDLSISKSHCKVNYFEGIGLCVQDCNSRHGTAVDGVTVSSLASVKSDPQSVTKLAIIKSPLSTITLGRVVLGFRLKPTRGDLTPPPPQTLAKSFQPNQEIGQRLYEATRLSQQISLNKKVFSNKSHQQSQFHLDPLLPYHLIHPMICPPPPPPLLSPVADSKQMEPSQEVSRVSQDIDSENFVGRNLLLKMGWERGVKLGKSGGVDEGPIQVTNKQDRSGLGMQRQIQVVSAAAVTDGFSSEAYRLSQSRKRKMG